MLPPLVRPPGVALAFLCATTGVFGCGVFDKGETEVIEDTRDQYEIMRIIPAQIGGTLAIVTLGTKYVRVFARSDNAWRGTTIAGAARDVAVGDLDGTAGDELLVIGDTSAIIDLRGVLK